MSTTLKPPHLALNWLLLAYLSCCLHIIIGRYNFMLKLPFSIVIYNKKSIWSNWCGKVCRLDDSIWLEIISPGLGKYYQDSLSLVMRK
jgi:hypothetical protein